MGTSMNTDVAAYIGAGLTWQQAALNGFREAILRAIPSAEETMQYGKPHYSSDGEIVAALHLASAKGSLLILNAEAVTAEKGFSRSLGDGSRKVIDATDGAPVDLDRVIDVLNVARAAR